MKRMNRIFVAALAACMAFGAYAAESTANWEYDLETKTISDGLWTFEAKLSGSNITVNNITTNDFPNPTEVSPLDFSKKVVKKGDALTEYTITDIEALFHYYYRDHLYKPGSEYVGKFTLPGEGLVKMGDDGLRVKNASDANAFGDIVVPSTVTSVGRYWFQYSKITSITFGASKGASLGSEAIGACSSLTSVVFKAGGNYTILKNARPFSGCSKLGDVDISGVVSVSGDSTHAAFGSCSALTNITINSDIVLENSGSGTIGNALFNGNGKLATIRFTGAAPDELDNWINGDGGYLGCLADYQSVTTIVPAEYRNVTNGHGKCWMDYSPTKRLNTTDSTFASEYLKDGTVASNRKLILDREPEDDPPVVEDPTISDVWAYQATVTANGSGIRGGTVFVSLTTNNILAIESPVEFSDFGVSHTFTGLALDTEYKVVVVATNAYGSVTNATASFTTLAKQADVSIAKIGDADFNKKQNGSFVISRADNDVTDYALTVKYTIGGTAVAGTDYAAIPATVTIPVGEKSETITVVPLYCETQVEGDTTVSISLTDDPGYAVGTRSQTVNIKKVEAVHYSIAAGTNPTGTTRGTFVVSRGANDSVDQKVTLTYTISGAGAGVIFPLSGTVVIPPYATSATIEVFANNAEGSDAPLTVTIDDGHYTLVTSSATIIVAAGAASEYWLVAYDDDLKCYCISCGDWKFSGVDYSRKTVNIGNSSSKGSPSEVSPLDFSLPVVDAEGNRYVITQVSMRGASAAAKAVVGELTLPGEGLTSIDYAAFNGCANITGTLVFPTSCTTIGGESFTGRTNIKIIGSSITGWKYLSGKENLTGVTFVGEALALSFEESGLENATWGTFAGANIGAIRFGPGLKRIVNPGGRPALIMNCSSLTNVVFDPASHVSLENGATFSGCKALKEIDLSAVTNITCGTQLGTFYNCSALTNVVFGADLHYLASNVFEQAFDSTAAKRTITFKGLPPEGFEMPYLAKANANNAVITTFVQSRYLAKTNGVGKCWNDYAAGGKIGCGQSSTWASAYLPEGVDPSKRPLRTRKGLIIIME